MLTNDILVYTLYNKIKRILNIIFLTFRLPTTLFWVFYKQPHQWLPLITHSSPLIDYSLRSSDEFFEIHEGLKLTFAKVMQLEW